ncbi:hypothetical protein BN873_470011 [Candidatus Competibacter denitrificans Run_A_D11]|uniref:Uncharacterized protein n=1 Tax=Candidatus Competibacter denitrificans Run_A_D11 TaxID=1400863 RepID=W6M9I8_9GAMM|nr:hypothetical protein [Candidatus Competibacter denitrificans]CDI03269.1 hypothetical protein BN873_470011 [Candidatus Competibacter denitrificans Run_A_D11]HAS87327.1 hypothetical protein [Candidatus Competibacteraceae bacterium]HRC69956.1 hypothetical protein [Candidatus Competibacter denitrificans]
MAISLLKALTAARQSDGAAAVLMIIYGKTKILREYPTLRKESALRKYAGILLLRVRGNKMIAVN